MTRSTFFNDLQSKIGQVFENSPAKDLEKNMKAMLSQGFSRLDLVTREEFDVQAQVLAKTRAKVDALEARLTEDLGPVRMVLHDSGESCDPWVAAFLALERAGWKGRASSALACDSASSALFREVIRHGHRNGVVRLASLTAGGKIVAMTSWFVAGGHAYGFKMAFDEACRSAAPGRLLMRHVARTLDGEPPVLFDTCAARDAPADPLWPDRRSLGSFAVAIGSPARRRLFDAVMRA